MIVSPAACVSETSGKANWCGMKEAGDGGVAGPCEESEAERERRGGEFEEVEGEDGENEEYKWPKDDEHVE